MIVNCYDMQVTSCLIPTVQVAGLGKQWSSCKPEDHTGLLIIPVQCTSIKLLSASLKYFKIYSTAGICKCNTNRILWQISSRSGSYLRTFYHAESQQARFWIPTFESKARFGTLILECKLAKIDFKTSTYTTKILIRLNLWKSLCLVWRARTLQWKFAPRMPTLVFSIKY